MAFSTRTLVHGLRVKEKDSKRVTLKKSGGNPTEITPDAGVIEIFFKVKTAALYCMAADLASAKTKLDSGTDGYELDDGEAGSIFFVLGETRKLYIRNIEDIDVTHGVTYVEYEEE